MILLYILQIMQSIGFLGPAFFLTQLSHVRTPALAVLCMACSQVSYHVFFLKLYFSFFESYKLAGSWDDVFKVAVVLYIIGTLVWNIFSTGEKILD
ncbi:hypothetical protein GW17_00049222 [Ensete ventricosum]|nr:hypothetical protein GW17_00049222 [Ensete ventricosum]